jgi:hypothetical protein
VIELGRRRTDEMFPDIAMDQGVSIAVPDLSVALRGSSSPDPTARRLNVQSARDPFPTLFFGDRFASHVPRLAG